MQDVVILVMQGIRLHLVLRDGERCSGAADFGVDNLSIDYSNFAMLGQTVIGSRLKANTSKGKVNLLG